MGSIHAFGRSGIDFETSTGQVDIGFRSTDFRFRLLRFGTVYTLLVSIIRTSLIPLYYSFTTYIIFRIFVCLKYRTSSTSRPIHSTTSYFPCNGIPPL